MLPLPCPHSPASPDPRSDAGSWPARILANEPVKPAACERGSFRDCVSVNLPETQPHALSSRHSRAPRECRSASLIIPHPHSESAIMLFTLAFLCQSDNALPVARACETRILIVPQARGRRAHGAAILASPQSHAFACSLATGMRACLVRSPALHDSGRLRKNGAAALRDWQPAAIAGSQGTAIMVPQAHGSAFCWPAGFMACQALGL